jgi:tetratricopeptide (TPR) repeat protein
MALSHPGANGTAVGRIARLAVVLTMSAWGGSAAIAESESVSEPDPQQIEKIENLHKAIQVSPQDAKLRFQLGKALLAVGNSKQAGTEFLEATALEPSMYIAYHQFTLCKPSNEQLDEATERLNHLKDEHPNDLMLRVALSEVLEQRGDCYAAARSLIDLTYTNAVPPAYVSKVQARIHFLLSRTKDIQTVNTEKGLDAGMEPLTAPPPDWKNGLAAGKGHNGDEKPDFGHSSLMP